MIQEIFTIAYAIKFVSVMVSMILADMCWATYFIKVGNREALKAGFWSMLIILFGAFCTTEYVHDKTMIFAAMTGAFIGSFITVKWNHNKENK